MSLDCGEYAPGDGLSARLPIQSLPDGIEIRGAPYQVDNVRLKVVRRYPSQNVRPTYTKDVIADGGRFKTRLPEFSAEDDEGDCVLY